MSKITTNELKEIKQKLCPHHYIQPLNLDNTVWDYECLDCGKSFFITEVIAKANHKLRDFR